MAGRPINKDREMAIFLGERTYVGTPHKKCGTTERYTSGGGCVHCARVIATEQRDARKFLQRQTEIDSRGDQGGGYPSSQGPLDNSEPMALEEDDAEARRQASIDELM